jgi:hypothetical protein
VVGQRAEDEIVLAQAGQSQAAGGGAELVAKLALGQPADETTAERAGRQAGQLSVYRLGQHRAEPGLGAQPLEHELARLVDLECFGQQLTEQVDADTALAQRIGERVVLLTRPADPEHVVEQQLVLVGRGQP